MRSCLFIFFAPAVAAASSLLRRRLSYWGDLCASFCYFRRVSCVNHLTIAENGSTPLQSEYYPPIKALLCHPAVVHCNLPHPNPNLFVCGTDLGNRGEYSFAEEGVRIGERGARGEKNELISFRTPHLTNNPCSSPLPSIFTTTMN